DRPVLGRREGELVVAGPLPGAGEGGGELDPGRHHLADGGERRDRRMEGDAERIGLGMADGQVGGPGPGEVVSRRDRRGPTPPRLVADDEDREDPEGDADIPPEGAGIGGGAGAERAAPGAEGADPSGWRAGDAADDGTEDLRERFAGLREEGTQGGESV